MYKESFYDSTQYREMLVKEANDYLKVLIDEAEVKRKDFNKYDFGSIEGYTESIKSIREEFVQMLGKPLLGYEEPKEYNYKLTDVYEEERYKCQRLLVEVLPGVNSYGLLYTPKKEGKFPFITLIHGAWGTPEKVASFYQCDNYNDVLLRLLEKGDYIIYIPQQIMWVDEFNDEKSGPDHTDLDTRFKQVGASYASFELCKMLYTRNFIIKNFNVDESKIGNMGLSYGGFFSYMLSAIDERVKATLSICFFGDRIYYPWYDFTWYKSAEKFLDPQVAALICPRYLALTNGKNDEIYDYSINEKPCLEVKEHYKKLGIEDKFYYKAFDGSHEVPKEDEQIDWFLDKLING